MAQTEVEQFARKAVLEHIDDKIRAWRERQATGNVMAKEHIDAYQAIRVELYGSPLPAFRCLLCGAMYPDPHRDDCPEFENPQG